jgi:hypothetical protein
MILNANAEDVFLEDTQCAVGIGFGVLSTGLNKLKGSLARKRLLWVCKIFAVFNLQSCPWRENAVRCSSELVYHRGGYHWGCVQQLAS